MLTQEQNCRKTVLICSGGLDSVCLAYRLAAGGRLALILSFNYGQRHRKELDFARQCAADLGAPFQQADIAAIGALLSGSALTDAAIAVPDGHYAQENMQATIVPNRNALFLTIAFALAGARKADSVAIAAHGGDHFIYPDCRPEFLQSFDAMERLAMEDAVRLIAPYAEKTKADIVADGARLNVPFAKTWSCYKGGAKHCGRCGTCVERREAFFAAGVEDPTEYEDPDYWQAAVKNYQQTKRER